MAARSRLNYVESGDRAWHGTAAQHSLKNVCAGKLPAAMQTRHNNRRWVLYIVQKYSIFEQLWYLAGGYNVKALRQAYTFTISAMRLRFVLVVKTSISTRGIRTPGTLLKPVEKGKTLIVAPKTQITT